MYDKLKIREQSDSIRITFDTDKINILNAKKFETLILGLMDDQHNIILDFNNIVFIDSTGFAMLHKLKIQSFINKIDIKYINESPELQELINFINQN